MRGLYKASEGRERLGALSSFLMCSLTAGWTLTGGDAMLLVATRRAISCRPKIKSSHISCEDFHIFSENTLPSSIDCDLI